MRILALLFLASTCFGQLTTQSMQPFFRNGGSYLFNYGSLFLYVNAVSSNGTNYINNDLRTSLKDWGTNNWTISVTANGTRIRTDIMSNNIPCILQTNGVSEVGINGGFGVPAQWMTAANQNTNFTITWVALAKAPEPTDWVYSQNGDGTGGNGYLVQSVGGTRLESWDNSGGTDVTTAFNAITTNQWVIYTVVHGPSAAFNFYTNNILCFSGSGTKSYSVGSGASNAKPQFFGVIYSGHANWTGAWQRAMMWNYVLSDSDRTNYYNNIKTELGLTSLP